jgi:thiaminase
VGRMIAANASYQRFFGKDVKIMKTKLVLCALLACMASAAALGQTVSVNYNRSQSFSQYHTYTWASDNANQIDAGQQINDCSSIRRAHIRGRCKGGGPSAARPSDSPYTSS